MIDHAQARLSRMRPRRGIPLREMALGYQVYGDLLTMDLSIQAMNWHTIPTSPTPLPKATPNPQSAHS